jgi:hypothetical protein
MKKREYYIERSTDFSNKYKSKFWEIVAQREKKEEENKVIERENLIKRQK